MISFEGVITWLLSFRNILGRFSRCWCSLIILLSVLSEGDFSRISMISDANDRLCLFYFICFIRWPASCCYWNFKNESDSFYIELCRFAVIISKHYFFSLAVPLFTTDISSLFALSIHSFRIIALYYLCTFASFRSIPRSFFRVLTACVHL